MYRALDHVQYVSEETRRRLHLLFLVVAAFAFVIGVGGIVRLLREVGRPFGGFIWIWTASSRGLEVVTETPWHWPGPQHGLQGGDRMLAIDGRDPMTFPAVYQARAVGERITYVVEREGRQYTIQVPLSRFTPAQFLEAYGLVFLIGLSCLLAGYVIMRNTRDWPTFLVAFALLALAGTPLFYGHSGSISHFHRNLPARFLLFIPSYPLAGALLTHFFLIFPRPFTLLRERPWLVQLPYLAAGALVIFSAMAFLVGGSLDALAFRLFLLSVATGALLSTARSLWSFLRAEPAERGRIGTLGSILAVGLFLVLGTGVIPFLRGRPFMLLNQLFIPLAILYPLALVYAVKNVELIGQLRREIARQEQLEAETRELRAIRERTLHEVADALHDTVVSDLKGLQLWLAEARRSSEEQARAVGPADLEALEQTADKIYQEVRRIMEGAKPVDFATEGLLAALERSIAHFRHVNPELEVQLDVGFYDEDYPAAVKEEVYWIVQTALANSRDHAGARCVMVALSKAENSLHVIVQDDGAGFDVGEALSAEPADERRHLGLRNMQVRAARIGAELSIESGPHGTALRLAVPLPAARPRDLPGGIQP